MMRCARRTVQKWVQRWEEENTIQRKKNPGSDRPALIDIVTEANIHASVESDPRLRPSQIVASLKLICSKWTVQRCLKGIGFKYLSALPKPDISEDQKAIWLAWCLARQDWTIDKWSKVVFTDEKTFQSFSTGNVKVWRKKGDVNNSKAMDRLNSKLYLEILNKILPSIDGQYPDEIYTFQQDNCPVHTAKVIKNYFVLREVEVLEWPSYSPDLNIIENLWGILAQIVNFIIESLGKPKNKNDLFMLVDSAWEIAYNKDYISTLYESLPRIMKLVIENGGDSIKY
ncbi:Transposable element Tc1 transposase-like protein [Dinothrombium tinctorium]|uniref:Transposable element Tc1 transposase-like protein n=1 Tax=Dinothrombium tinctorium TaxID=1965070 RepID=A0A443QTX2_9ACAR|nr:Transposable element Tc1 transposase-like protein [Dinothrombium tinctorium]